MGACLRSPDELTAEIQFILETSQLTLGLTLFFTNSPILTGLCCHAVPIMAVGGKGAHQIPFPPF